MEPASVLIVDDSSLMRQSLRFLLDATETLQVVGEAASAAECLQLYESIKPDIVTVDIAMPGTSGLELLADLKTRDPAPRVVIITNYPYPGFRARSVDLGADLFLAKSDDPALIAESISALVDGISPMNEVGDQA